jgi:hypothetical protein
MGDSSLPSTPVTDQIFKLAETAGLRPYWAAPYGNSREIRFDPGGPAGPFGTILVGLRSGRILRATIVYGSDGPSKSYQGAVAVRNALKAIAEEAQTDA